jgi:hypothetical protein
MPARPRLIRARFWALALALAAHHVAAASGVVAVVASKSAIPKLTRSQVADLFLGRTSRLPDGLKATPLDLPEGSPLRDAFYAAFSGKSPAQVKAHWSKIIFTGRGEPPAQLPDSAAAKRALAADLRAIAYIDPAQVDGSVRVISP